MKMFSLIFLVFAASLQAAPYKVRVAQVEYVRNKAYFPDASMAPSVMVEDGSPSTHAVDTGISDHATQVLRLLVSGKAQGLVGSVVEIEAVSFAYPARTLTNPYGLNAGRTFEPAKADWDVENDSWGGYDALWDNDIIAREAKRLERDNVLAFIALSDPGLVAANGQNYRQLQACKSRNVIRVGSSISGQITTPEFTYDVLAPVQWTSFACPTVAQTGEAMVSALKTAGIVYNAGDLGDIIRAAAKANGMIHDHAACMKLLAEKYPALSPVSAPTPPPPVVTTIPTTSVSPPPPPTPSITPIQSPAPVQTATVSTDTTVFAPRISSFGHWNSAWSSPSTPTTFYWITLGADSVTLSDPTGKTQTVPSSGQLTVTHSSSAVGWTLDAKNSAGEVTKTDMVHGQF